MNPFHSCLHLTEYFLASKHHHETILSMDENHLSWVSLHSKILAVPGIESGLKLSEYEIKKVFFCY